MNKSIDKTLSDIFKQIDDTPENVKSSCLLTTINNTINYSENQLKSLQALEDNLSLIKMINKADALGLMRRIRSIYYKLGTWEEISDYWIEVKDKLNSVDIVFNGIEMTERLLIHKNIVVLNRTIFAATRTRNNLIKSDKLKRVK